ncbi:threonine--tRNA ligase [Candidatus Woesearchaeota archaeon]|nr:threonine--tRNA ligase [Candidatus Woesearchaeota archaeon]
MKILTIHADFIEFEAKKKALKDAEEVDKSPHRVEECLVVFTAVEKRDENNISANVERYVQEIKNVAQQVNAQNIVLYPYAHLSSQLANPKIAENVLKEAEKILVSKYKVTRAPFGWYKSFNISCKGHPLSELSREFCVGEIKEQEKSTPLASPATNLKREHKDEAFAFENLVLSDEQRLKLSAAFIVAKAVKELYPAAELGSCNFYNDQAYVDIANIKLKHEELIKVEKQAQKIATTGLKIEQKAPEVTPSLIGLQKDIAQDLGVKASVYSLGDLLLVAQFKHPFVLSSDKVGALRILNSSSVYWKNNANNSQLTRIYVVGFSSQHGLEEYLKKVEDAENRSHLKIGKEQNLFVISELVGPGLPLLAPRGMTIRNEIVKFLWELHFGKGYQQVWTPHIAKDLLYKTSGHWEKFGDELFRVRGKVDDFVLKPMNCPHHMQIFSSFAFSYKDMPVRYFEPATVYRDEKSGQLLGLSRVRSITQDDGHLFCRLNQITSEVRTIVGIIHEFYHTIGMDKDYWVRLGLRGEDKSKYLGTDEGWNMAQESLEKAAQELKLPYKRAEGEAVFYGPKLDFMFKDALGREWQLATIQCDFNLPERFNLSFVNERNEKERPVVIHRAISGSLERFMSVLIEHFAGKFPLWLSPVQVKVLTVTDRNNEFAREVVKVFEQAGLRVELNEESETIGKKVREAQIEKVNYMITIGDKETEARTLAVRSRDGRVEFGVDLNEFVEKLKTEVKERV